jgi:hypothetical protein
MTKMQIATAKLCANEGWKLDGNETFRKSRASVKAARCHFYRRLRWAGWRVLVTA